MVQIRKPLVALVLVVLLAGACSSGGSGGAAAAGDGDFPAWLTSITDKRPTKADADGVEVYVDEPNRTIYAERCDDGRALTAEGAKYGPSERDPETGKFTPGFAFICPSK